MRVPSIAVRLVLLVVAASLVVVGVAFLVRTHDINSERAVTNQAVSDSTQTAEVIGQVGTALDQVLSYDYQKPQVAQAAAKRWLTGAAPGQYRTLFAQLKKLAPNAQLTIVAKVSTAGVTYLHGNRAKLLVFVDQESTRASDGQSSTAAAQVEIGAVHHGHLWQIDSIVPL